ncbi:MAG: AMP-binding protein, partial [Nitrososphaerales archaeon]
MPTYDPTAYRKFFERHFTYVSGFRRNIHRYASRIAMECPLTGATWTYAGLGRDVDMLARGLRDAGVGAGDVVVYQLYNSPAFALLYLATQACGAVGSPVNFRLAPAEVAYILDDSAPKAFVYDTALGGVVGEALARCERRPDVLVAVGAGAVGAGAVSAGAVGDWAVGGGAVGEAAVLPGAVPFEELFVPGDQPVEVERCTFEETTRLYSSGTTGMPKGVPLNSIVEILSAHDVIMHFPLSPEDKTLNMTPW